MRSSSHCCVCVCVYCRQESASPRSSMCVISRIRPLDADDSRGLERVHIIAMAVYLLGLLIAVCITPAASFLLSQPSTQSAPSCGGKEWVDGSWAVHLCVFLFLRDRNYVLICCWGHVAVLRGSFFFV